MIKKHLDRTLLNIKVQARFSQPFIQEISIKLPTTDFDFQFVFPVNKCMFEVHKNKFVQFLFIPIIEKAKEKQHKLFERNFANLRGFYFSICRYFSSMSIMIQFIIQT